MAHPFFTIGHSTRPVDEFISLVGGVGIERVVDVRTIPRSRTNPQYNSDSFAQTLAKAGIDYEHSAALGGLRGVNRDIAPDLNAFWQNRSFHNYADYAMGDAFRAALAELRERGHATPSVIVCAEAVWWRCHRRIIADCLIAAGETVLHIMGPDHVDAAKLTPAARIGGDGSVTYPAE